ncbi:hypothetical protein pah_c008o075 [Parachlamydia acanthamoebae str. Hall's coccus]|nr:hypothetical protein pah_c008o075 [Parachlamydia acanthamoebae str. Hall's coccus]
MKAIINSVFQRAKNWHLFCRKIFKNDKEFPEKIKLIITENSSVQLIYLTKEIFDKCVKNQVSGSLKFSSDKEVQNYYLNTQF